MSVAEAMEAGLLPVLDEDQANMFSPSELISSCGAPDYLLSTPACNCPFVHLDSRFYMGHFITRARLPIIRPHLPTAALRLATSRKRMPCL